MTDIRDLLQERGSIVNAMQNLLNKAEGEGRDLNDTELESYNKMDSDQQELKNRADRMNKTQEIQSSLNGLVGESVKPNVGGRPVNSRATDEYRHNFDTFIRNNKDRVSSTVFNALETGTSSEGGYLVPEEFETKIVESLIDWNDFRQYVNVISTSSDRNIPIENTVGAAAYTAEEAAFNESDPAFGQKTISAYKATRIVKVSEELLEDAFFDIFGYLGRNFGKAFGLRQEQSIVAGTGSSQPNSLLSGATDSGTTFAGVAAITSDEIIEVFHGLSRPYRNRAQWVINDSTAKLIRKLKDNDGQYLWQSGLQAGQPDMILGRPVLSSQYMPEAGATNKSMLFGDLSGYTWAERTGRKVQRLDELYAATGQVGFRGYERHDGVVTDASAIVYADHAAS